MTVATPVALPKPDPPLGDAEIVLRPVTEDDEPAIAKACQEPEIARWTPISAPYSEANAAKYVGNCRRRWRKRKGAAFAILDAITGEFLGVVDVRMRDYPRASVGAWLKREARSRGIALRALRYISRWALTEAGIVRLAFLTDPQNEAARRLAEKAGFTREGVLRAFVEVDGRRRDRVVFSLLPEDLGLS
jgi:RimJ/RimL family protein N-acetyltransferase